MSSFNKVILMGYVGKDPEIKTIGSSGDTMALFSIATSETWKDKSGSKKSNTDWHNCVAFKGVAGIIEKYVGKGSLLLVEGKLKNNSYTNQEGKKITSQQVLVEKINMFGGKDSQGSSSERSEPEETKQDDTPKRKRGRPSKEEMGDYDDSDVPF